MLAASLVTAAALCIAGSAAAEDGSDPSEGGPYRLNRQRYRPNRGPVVALDKVLSAKSAARKKCGLVEVNFSFDSHSEDISWMVTLGDADDVQSEDFIVVAYSHLQYQYIDRERHSFCLPNQGQFTFTIFDWEGNGLENGSYSLVAEDGRVILEGTEFGWMKRHTFTLPLPAAPSMSPSQSQSPTVSPAPTFDCTYIDISITYDVDPEETSWMVIAGDYDSLEYGTYEIVAESPSMSDSIPDPLSTEIHRVCLPISIGTVFSFVVMDSGYTGMCCFYGEGGYVITSPDLPPTEIIAKGGEFGTLDVATFSIPFVVAPSTQPSSSPQPTASSHPTAACVDIEVQIQFDGFPYDVMWYIMSGDGISVDFDEDMVAFESPDYADQLPGAYVEHNLCLPSNEVYTFEIFDWSGDGMCCRFGDGYYLVTYGDDENQQVIAQGSTFQFSESTTFSTSDKSQAPDKDCFVVEVDLTFNTIPNEIKWVIVKGDLDDDDATILVESPSYDLNHISSNGIHDFCLEEGKYNFVIDSTMTGLESYSLKFIHLGEITLISEGDGLTKDDWIAESFSIPLIASTLKNAPVESCDLSAELHLAFDSYPYEISWVFCSGAMDCSENEDEVLEESSYYSLAYKNTEESFIFCLTEGSQYTFSISDTAKDGLCCGYGRGEYALSLQDGGDKVILSKGSDFGAGVSVTFNTSPAPPSPGHAHTPNPSSPTPPMDDCIDITLNFDVFPYEIEWWLVSGDLDSFENNEHEFIAKSPDYGWDIDRFANITHTVCLPNPTDWYSFMIFDDGSNGFQQGGYFLSHEGNIFASGGEFIFFDIRVFQTPFPTNSPTTPPFAPPESTLVPTPDCSLNTSLQIVIIEDETSSFNARWEVVMGSSSSLDNHLAILVATSQNADKISHICLSNGQYTFSMFDNAGYQLLVDGETISIATSRYLTSSVTFTIPIESLTSEDFLDIIPEYISHETQMPTASFSSSQPLTSMPTESFRPPLECIQLEISIILDSFPSETIWQLNDEYGNFIEGSPSYENYESSNATHTVCVDEGKYEFTIYDTTGDGMCCLHGNGSYSIVIKEGIDDRVIAEGGAFDFSETTTFTLPFKPLPTSSPTVSPAPSVSTAPTPACVWIEVVINFDANPMDTVWEIFVGDWQFDYDFNDDLDDATIVASSPIYYQEEYAFSTAKQSVCLPGRQMYTFFIMDGQGNGMCCDQGTGGYMLLLEEVDGYDEILIGDGAFSWSQSKTFDLTMHQVEVVAPRINSKQNEDGPI